MKNIRTAAILLSALAIIICGAFLPRFAAARQDAAGEKPGYAPIGEITLEFDERSQGLGIRDKYAVFTMEHDTLTLPVSMAGKSAAQVEALARKAVTEYQSAGLIPALSVSLTRDRIRMVPQMLRPLGEDTGFILWDITIDLDPAYGRSLYFLMDDETGAILTIGYQGDVSNEPTELDLLGLPDKMSKFCETFLDGLGTEFSQEDPAELAAGAASYPESHIMETSLVWADMRYGEIRLWFTMSPGYFTVTVLR